MTTISDDNVVPFPVVPGKKWPYPNNERRRAYMRDYMKRYRARKKDETVVSVGGGAGEAGDSTGTTD